ncbi:MAG: hypothetical protein WA728_12395 [Xanthobacteraceae bacterium]
MSAGETYIEGDARELTVSQAAVKTAESDVAPDHIEATLNYIVDDGSEVFTIVASPGGSDARSGGKPDPRRVTIHNGRQHAKDFVLERHGFRFVRHDTKVWATLRMPFPDRIEPGCAFQRRRGRESDRR